ncbi:MAG TPA: ECF transporter S component [Candidatus Dorea intestinavium]|nr:ECF transporter S component [Candidatus Dorea intestinavium]
MDVKNRKIVNAALFATLVFIATSVIKIPTPGANGYVHPGDALVILSGIVLGPIWGGLAAGIGSALADLLGGYVIFVPATFLIKAISAMLIGYVFKNMAHEKKSHYIGLVLAGVINAVVVVGGYCLFELVVFSKVIAFAGVIPNILQGITGLIISSLLYPLISRISYLVTE